MERTGRGTTTVVAATRRRTRSQGRRVLRSTRARVNRLIIITARGLLDSAIASRHGDTLCSRFVQLTRSAITRGESGRNGG